MQDTRAVAHRPSFHPHPLALVAASFAAGILLAHLAAPPLSLSLISGALSTLLALVACKRKRRRLATVAVVLAFAWLGAAFACAERRGVAPDRVRRLYEEGRVASGDPVEVEGVAARAPEFAPDGFYLTLKVERLRVRGSVCAATGTVELFAPTGDEATRAKYEELELRRGARASVMVALERAEEFRNPGGGSLTEFLERRGVDARGTIKSPLLIERLGDERVFLPLVWLEAWRERMRVRLAKQFSAETAGVLQAALLGNRYGLTHASAERFRASGTFHVLVISGLHISFIGFVVLALVRRVTKRRVWQFALPVAVLWSYALAVGAEASVVRAALMFTLVALAPVVGRRGATLNALGGAALVLLLARPSDLFDPSFQLTFLSVLGIVALGWPLVERLREVGAWHPTRATPHPPVCPVWFRVLGESLFWSERAWRRQTQRRNVYSYRLFKSGTGVWLERLRVQRVWRYAFGAMVVSASVQVMLLPFFVIYFHRVSLASIVLNIFVGVLMALASLGALAVLLLAEISASTAWPLAWLVEGLNWLMAHSVDPFERAGLASFRLPEYTGRAAIIYAFYYAPLAVLLVGLARWRPLQPGELLPDEDASGRGSTWRTVQRRTRRLAWASAGACVALVVLHPFSAGQTEGRLRLDLLDVGQGDAALLTFPDGATLLVDAGGRARFGRRAGESEDGPPQFERDARGIGEAVVSEYLWWRGLASVDYLLATHAHADHMNGLNDVARNFAVRAALVGRAERDEAEFAQFTETLRQERVPVELVGRGDRLRFGAATVDVLWPPRSADAPATRASSENNDSVVLRVRYGERAFLLTGDIERDAEAALVAAAAHDDLRSDVVKVAHHGSRTSSTAPFVAAVRPAIAVVSVGRASPFNHPDDAVVARWRDAGAQVLQTGRRGTITVSTDGRDLRVETFVRE